MSDHAPADFPQGTQSTGKDAQETASRKSRGAIWATTIGATVVVGALIAWGVVSSNGSDAEAAPAATVSEASASPSTEVSTEPSTKPSATPDQETTIGIPAECAAVYSPALFAKLRADLVGLNVDDSMSSGTKDSSLVPVIAANPHVRCAWGYAGELGITTGVVSIGKAEQARVLERLQAQKFTCVEANGGTECTSPRTAPETEGLAENETAPVGGEVHLLRDGIWVPTSYVNYWSEGYVADIAHTIWG